ncbi:MAG: peroxiredoxin [Candidatus Manganitrophaceae bacterium]
MLKEVEVGEEAPDFILKDQNEKEVRLADYRGKKNIVLAFYPLDWSPVCTNENKCLTNDLSKFQDKETEVFGISIDSTWSHKAWADALGLTHRLLSDMKREAVKKYGLFIEEANIGKRATVIIDKSGKVRYKKVQEILTARDNNEILDALEPLKNG